MRRFFHRNKAATARPTSPPSTATTPTLSRSRSTSSSSPVHAVGPTGRVRAPALRSRSMSVLNGPPGTSPPSRRFTRSLSFCAENQTAIASNSCISRQLTKSEEDEVFKSYTRRVYGLFSVLCAIIIGFVVYAYYYNYGNR